MWLLPFHLQARPLTLNSHRNNGCTLLKQCQAQCQGARERSIVDRESLVRGYRPESVCLQRYQYIALPDYLKYAVLNGAYDETQRYRFNFSLLFGVLWPIPYLYVPIFLHTSTDPIYVICTQKKVVQASSHVFSRKRSARDAVIPINSKDRRLWNQLPGDSGCCHRRNILKLSKYGYIGPAPPVQKYGKIRP